MTGSSPVGVQFNTRVELKNILTVRDDIALRQRLLPERSTNQHPKVNYDGSLLFACNRKSRFATLSRSYVERLAGANPATGTEYKSVPASYNAVRAYRTGMAGKHRPDGLATFPVVKQHAQIYTSPSVYLCRGHLLYLKGRFVRYSDGHLSPAGSA